MAAEFHISIQAALTGARQALPPHAVGAATPFQPGRCPVPVGFLPAWRHRHFAIAERRAVAVARSVERRQHFRGKPAGFA